MGVRVRARVRASVRQESLRPRARSGGGLRLIEQPRLMLHPWLACSAGSGERLLSCPHQARLGLESMLREGARAARCEHLAALSLRGPLAWGEGEGGGVVNGEGAEGAEMAAFQRRAERDHAVRAEAGLGEAQLAEGAEEGVGREGRGGRGPL